MEDDYLARAIAAALGDLEARVSICHDGEEALALLRAVRHELVIADVGLPGLKGDALAAALRAHARPPRVILISGRGPDELAALAAIAGAHAWLEKPFSAAAIAVLAADILGR